MTELIKSLLESSKERIKNPLIGALAFSWVFINWKIVFIILFSKQTIENKITHIESSYIEPFSNYIYPSCAALIYLIILPYISQSVEWLIKRSVLARKSNKTDMLVKDIKGKEKLARHINILEKFKADNKSLIELNRKIKELESENESLKNNVLDLKNKTSDNFDVEYSEFKNIPLYKTFKDVGLSVSETEKFPVFTDAMEKQKYISHGILKETIKPGERNYSIFFTNKGDYFWNKYVKESQPNNGIISVKDIGEIDI